MRGGVGGGIEIPSYKKLMNKSRDNVKTRGFHLGDTLRSLEGFDHPCTAEFKLDFLIHFIKFSI